MRIRKISAASCALVVIAVGCRSPVTVAEPRDIEDGAATPSTGFGEAGPPRGDAGDAGVIGDPTDADSITDPVGADE